MRWLILALAAHRAGGFSIDSTSASNGGEDPSVNSCVLRGSCIETRYFSSGISKDTANSMRLALENGAANREFCVIQLDANTNYFLYYKNLGTSETSDLIVKTILGTDTTYSEPNELPRRLSDSGDMSLRWNGPEDMFNGPSDFIHFRICTEPRSNVICTPFKFLNDVDEIDNLAEKFMQYTVNDGTTVEGCIEPIGTDNHKYAAATFDLEFEIPTSIEGTIDFFGTHPLDTLSIALNNVPTCELSGDSVEPYAVNPLNCGGTALPFPVDAQTKATVTWQHKSPYRFKFDESSIVEPSLDYPNDDADLIIPRNVNPICSDSSSTLFPIYNSFKDCQADVPIPLEGQKTETYPKTNDSFVGRRPATGIEVKQNSLYQIQGQPVLIPDFDKWYAGFTTDDDPVPENQGGIYFFDCVKVEKFPDIYTVALSEYLKYPDTDPDDKRIRIEFITGFYFCQSLIAAVDGFYERNGWRACAQCPLVTVEPTHAPSHNPSGLTSQPSSAPSDVPSDYPTETPSKGPTPRPTFDPSYVNPPTSYPTATCKFQQDKNPYITLIGNDDVTDYKKSLLSVIARAGKLNGESFPLFGIGDYSEAGQYKLMSQAGQLTLTINGAAADTLAKSNLYPTINDYDIIDWIALAYTETTPDDLKTKEFISKIDNNVYSDATDYTIKIRADDDSYIKLRTGSDTIYYTPVDFGSNNPLEHTLGYTGTWRSAVHAEGTNSNNLCSPTVVLPYYGDEYDPVITCDKNDLNESTAYAFCTPDPASKHSDCDTTEGAVNGWVYKKSETTFVMLNYTGNISPSPDDFEIIVGPNADESRGPKCHMPSPSADVAKIGIINTKHCGITDCANNDETTTLTPIDISECDGYYAHEFNTTLFGQGESNVKRYLQSLKEEENVKWHQAQGHFWGGAYVDNDEHEYTWFTAGSFDFYPVARFILAPHQKFTSENPPAFIELKFVFDKCDQTTFRCSIRSHPIDRKTIGEWNPDTTETQVKRSARDAFLSQSGHSWYKNGVAVHRYVDDDDNALKGHSDIYFAPYNSPFMLRVSVDSTSKQADDVSSCYHAGTPGCEHKPHDGWHDDHNNGCVHYNDRENDKCTKGKPNVGSSITCQHPVKNDCKECVTADVQQTGLAVEEDVTLYDFCKQCNPDSEYHTNLTFTIKLVDGELDFLPRRSILSYNYVCEGKNTRNDRILASKLVGLGNGVFSPVRAVSDMFKDGDYYHLMTFGTLTLEEQNFLEGQTVEYQCYDTLQSIPQFTNGCSKFPYESELHPCSQENCELFVQWKKSSKCIKDDDNNAPAAKDCKVHLNSPQTHCAECGGTEAIPARKNIKYRPSIVPLSIMNWPEDGTENKDTLVDEAFSPTSQMLFSDVVQLGTDSRAPITFIPQGIPYKMEYDWNAGCALNVCDEMVIHERELTARDLPNEIQPFPSATCDVKVVRVELDLKTDDKTDWSQEQGKFDDTKLERIDNKYADVTSAKVRCDELGSTVCYAVGNKKDADDKANDMYYLYAVSDLKNYPFYTHDNTGDFEIHIRQLRIGQSFFHSLCRSNLDIETLVLSHATPLPMEVSAVNFGAFNGCQNLNIIEFKNIVFDSGQSVANLYGTLDNIDVTEFKLSFDNNIANSIKELTDYYFTCDPIDIDRGYDCNVKTFSGDHTTPKWSTTKTYTRRRERVSDNDRDQRENRIIVGVVAGVAAFLIICVSGILIVKHRRKSRTNEESYPLTNLSQGQ